MKRKDLLKKVLMYSSLLAMVMAGGCGKQGSPKEPDRDVVMIDPADTSESVIAVDPVGTSEPEESADPVGEQEANTDPAGETETAEPAEAAETGSVRKDGERFEDTIILEGMEETVRYEHIINETIGFEIDYDYEMLVRSTGSDSERFISIYDDQNKPENYIEVTYCPDDADTAAAAVSGELSKEYTINSAPYDLKNSGECIRIDASETKEGGYMPEQLQMVYIIPADDGCRIVTAHYAIEAAEGFGRRFSNIINTLVVIEK